MCLYYYRVWQFPDGKKVHLALNVALLCFWIYQQLQLVSGQSLSDLESILYSLVVSEINLLAR